LIILVARRGLFRFTARRIRFFVVTSILGYILPLGGTLYAAQALSAGMLALLISLAPLFTFGAAALFRTEQISGLRIAAMLTGCVATALVLLPEAAVPDLGLLPWMLLALLIPFCYGVESVFIDANWPPELDVIQVGFGEALIATLLLLPLMLLRGEPLLIAWQWNPGSYAMLVFAASGIIEVVMYFYLIKTTGAVLVSFATFVSLFAGIGWGMLLFAETHDRWLWLAAAVLVAALTMVSLDALRTRRRVDATHPQ
ncbi:MAG: DMT family transporter, partial [Rhodobacter sp.]|nr:DMT family transporter [Rhodobacter sp.]